MEENNPVGKVNRSRVDAGNYVSATTYAFLSTSVSAGQCLILKRDAIRFTPSA
jgi:hypothetical protein